MNHGNIYDTNDQKINEISKWTNIIINNMQMLYKNNY